MKNFHEIAKQFAAWHPEMLHADGANKRMFLVRSIAAMSDFTKTLPKNQSPCVAVDITPDMRVNDTKRGWRHTIYILVKSEAKAAVDADADTAAIEHGYELMNTFMAWCLAHYERRDKQFLGLMFEGDAYPYGPLANGWYAICLDVTDWKNGYDCLEHYTDKPL